MHLEYGNVRVGQGILRALGSQRCGLGKSVNHDCINTELNFVLQNVAFRKGTNQLYSGSFDRTVKVYDLSTSVMGYVETLFGHQDHISGLDALRGETCVTVGSRDKTLRYWKIVEETQIVLRGGGRSRIREVLEGGLLGDDEDGDGMEAKSKGEGKAKEQENPIEGSLECVAMIDETTFLSGGDSG